MQADFWHARWEQNQIAFHQEQINQHLQVFWAELAMPADSQIFVPLCGKSLDMLWLRAQGYRVLGVELSPIAVRDFFTDNGLTPTVTKQGKFECWEADGITLLLGDFFDLGTEELADCVAVFDRAALIALPPSMRTAYAQHLRQCLVSTAPILLVTMEYLADEMQGPPFAVLENEVHALYEPFYQVQCLYHCDALQEAPHFQKRGITQLTEKVYRLRHD